MSVLRKRASGIRRGASSSAFRILAPAAIIVAMMTTGIAVTLRNASPVLGATDDCPIAGPPPQTLVFAVDTTNQLVADEPRTVELNLEAGIAKLPAGSRVALVEIGAVAPTEPVILFSRCLPGNADNAARNRFRQEVMTPLKAHLATLSARPEAPTSAIVETVLALVDDENLHRKGTALTIRLETDGLQNSAYANAYRAKPFPMAPAGTLRGVDIEIDALRNPKAVAEQPKAFDRLTEWLRGGTPSHLLFERPAWLALAAGGKKHVSSR